MQHEAEEQHQENDEFDEFEPPHDAFIDEGLTESDISDTPSLGSGSSDDLDNPISHAHRGPVRLRRGKKKRESLKKKWFRAKEKRQQERAHLQRSELEEELGGSRLSSVSGSDS